MSICTLAPVSASNSPTIGARRVTDVSPIPSIFSSTPSKGFSAAAELAVAASAAAQAQDLNFFIPSPPNPR
ncbi:hypothetical protein [Mesorhizobium sp. L48C026A00]|uniref:hypothetical protein n=1 Tax=Mesorhizobium sp. L48C026A00 TaxID=1287182 RepID=UPI001FD9E3E6|nr:hypothetical protein [Mesorhizobium sp. L48C026A00]